MPLSSSHPMDLSNAGRVDAALWLAFANAKATHERDQAWLELQCVLIPQAVLGVLAKSGSRAAAFAPVALWPSETRDAQHLSEIIEQVIEDRCGLITQIESAEDVKGRQRYAVACPILEDERLQGVVAVEVLVGGEAELQAVMGQLHWGTAWQELLLRRQRHEEDLSIQRRLRSATDLLAAVHSEVSFEAAAMTFVTELATELQCARVSMGFVRKGHARVKAVSHSAQFGKRMNLIRCIGLVMDEAIDQRSELVYPDLQPNSLMILREHEQLAQQQGAGSVLSIPLYRDQEYYGAVTCERNSDQPFTTDEITFCRSVTALVGPTLEDKRRNDRLLIAKIYDSLGMQARRLLGPDYVGRKFAMLGIALLALFCVFAKGDYRVGADVVLEGEVRRVIAAPFAGYVSSAPLRAGDQVGQGDLLAALDDKELRLERMRWSSQQAQLSRQYQDAVAKHDRAQSAIISAQVEQADAQLALVESKLERTQITAPFDGFVVNGDLGQNLGGAVQQGEVLFEITPLDAYRVILKVDETRISNVRLEQSGELILEALPDEVFPFTVTKITAVATAEEGINYFRVEASLKTNAERLRPGMLGVGKIFVDRRLFISIWTRDLVQWLKFKAWAWWP